MKQTISRSLVPVSVIVITVLMILNIVATLRNNRIIEENRSLQKEAENIKVTVSQFAIVIIHNLDLGLRGYALFHHDKYLNPLRFALRDKDSLMHAVEKSLTRQKYPLDEFNQLRDSINAYATFCLNLKVLFDSNRIEEFQRLADMDKGYHLWLQYEKFERKVSRFEDEINGTAQKKYESAMQNNYLIQVVLLLISVPTLLFTAYHTRKEFALEVKLRASEAEKAALLATQNATLENIIQERTKEIQEQNKALQAQHEEILAQNDELHQQQEQLAIQNQALIESRRQQLELYTQSIVEKSEIIGRISAELESYKNRPVPEQEQIEKFSKILNSNIVTDEDWEHFKKKFQDVYPNFFAGLRFRFPDITVSEQRLSALIKLNLSLKEAADTLGISPESVKKSRHRLKKKLDIPEEESLEEFIKKMG